MDILLTELEGKQFLTQPKKENKWKRVSSWNDLTNMEQNIKHFSTEELTNKQTELELIRKITDTKH